VAALRDAGLVDVEVVAKRLLEVSAKHAASAERALAWLRA
jgi:hypothetical protein